jgi:hypothetical protein
MSSLFHRLHLARLPGGDRRLATAAAAVLLAGCSSVSLDEPVRRAPPVEMPPPAAAPAPQPPPVQEPVPPPVAPPETFPAPPSDTAAAPSDLTPPPPASAVVAYPDAVAARFPDPPVRHATPGTADGREQFTTQSEMESLLAGVALGGGSRGAYLVRLGASQSGTALNALLFTRSPGPEPADLVESGRPTVLLIGQQHGDEPVTAEALLAVVQELAGGRLSGLLERINVLVMPRANPDGAASAQRASADGTDLNRDHLLLRTPEAQALARLVRSYQPMVVVDVHEHAAVGPWMQKFGAMKRHDVLVQHAMTPNMPALVTRAAEEWFRQPLVKSLAAQQLSTEWYHVTSDDPADRTVAMGTIRPETARNANGLKNAVSLLLEGRGSDLGRVHLQRRVHALFAAVESVLSTAAQRAEALVKLRRYIEAEVSAQACRGETVVAATPTRTEYRLTFIDPQTGADKTLTVDWDSALDLLPRKLRPRACGYWLSAQAGDAVARLRNFGVAVQQIDLDARVPGDTYRRLPGDGTTPQVELVHALVDMPAGSYYVALTQPLANLVIAALEPDAPGSYVAGGLVPGVESVARIQTVPDLTATPLP